MSDKTKRKKFFATSVMCLYSQAPCKRRYYYSWPTTPNIFVYYMLRPFVHPAAIWACCWELLRKVWNLSNFWPTNSQHFFCSVIAEAKRKNVGSILRSSSCLVGATHAHHTWSTWILQSLMGCILPTMHWSVQHCCKWKKFNATAAHFYLSLKEYPVIVECDTELVRGYPSIG